MTVQPASTSRSTTAHPTTQRAPASTPVSTPAPAGGYIVYVPKSVTSGLRIRKQASTSGALLRVASAGEWLAV